MYHLSGDAIITSSSTTEPMEMALCPWSRLHLDFAGPFQGRTSLILIDAHSKWIEAVNTSSISSFVVIKELGTAKFDLP